MEKLSVQKTKERIVEIVKREYRLGMVNMFEGNVSARVGDRIFVTPSQVAKEEMTPDMLIETDPDGNVIHRPEGFVESTEAKMHYEVYRLRPDVRAVVHNHSPYATAFAMDNLPIETYALTEMNQIFGTIPVVPYGTPGTERIYAGFKEIISNRYALLLENHGLITFGATLELAFSYAEGAEKSARCIFLAKTLGKTADLPEEEIAALREFGNKKRDREIAAAIEFFKSGGDML